MNGNKDCNRKTTNAVLLASLASLVYVHPYSVTGKRKAVFINKKKTTGGAAVFLRGI
jgi:hypothetical protein